MLLKFSRRAFSISETIAKAVKSGTGKFEVPPLPYDIHALEPVISGEIMDLHYNKHHKAYAKELQKGIEMAADGIEKNDAGKMALAAKSINFGAGGFENHCIYWTNLAPPKEGGGVHPSEKSPLNQAFVKQWGSINVFILDFSHKTLIIQGSGWGWLCLDKYSGLLRMSSMQNQDPISLNTNLVPLLGIDVWEHAYYLQHGNERALYMKDIWKVVNWKNVEERYTAGMKEYQANKSK